MHDARDRNAGVWIEHSDRLYVAAYSSVASLVVHFSGYFRKANGDIIEYAVTVNPTSDRTVTESNVFFGAGFLLSCVATLASGNANRGQCYVRAMVQRSTGTPMVKLHNVVGGYLTDDFSPSFPYGQLESPLEGAGMLRSITGTDPAAGVEISETVPTGARWQLRMGRVSFVTSAAVAARFVEIMIDDGTLNLLRIPSETTLPANTTTVFNIANFPLNHFTNSGESILAVPPSLMLFAGWRVRTVTTLLQAGDNFGAPQLLVEEWIEA